MFFHHFHPWQRTCIVTRVSRGVDDPATSRALPETVPSKEGANDAGMQSNGFLQITFWICNFKWFMYPISHFLTQHFTHIIHIIGNCPFLPDKIYIIDYNRNTKSYLSFHQQKRWLKQHNFSHLWQNQEPSHGCIGGARNFARILLLWNSLRRHGLKLGGGTRELR